MPNVMVALPNIGGALCSTPHYSVQRRKVWLMLTTWLPCSNGVKSQKPWKLAGVLQIGKLCKEYVPVGHLYSKLHKIIIFGVLHSTPAPMGVKFCMATNFTPLVQCDAPARSCLNTDMRAVHILLVIIIICPTSQMSICSRTINIPSHNYTCSIHADFDSLMSTVNTDTKALLPVLHPFNSLFSRTTWVSWHQKPFWISLEQEMMGWQWHHLNHMQIICTSLQTDYHAGSSYVNVFTQQMHFLMPNRIKALRYTLTSI